MHRVVRAGAVLATGILATVALTGCGSDSDAEKSDPGKDSAAGQETPGRGSGDGGGDGASAGDASTLEGGWAGKTNGKAIVLSVSAGKAALVTEERACTGTVQDTTEVVITLKCVNGGTDRTSGSVESNDGKTVVISWDSGVKDTLAKTEPGALPSGLPELPDMSDLPAS
ncbi:hypothetical protein ACFYW1_27335 [Streptomyces sp. NPDC002669]|uniref:hypothetical protein n=1 Tax=Streptomyces sp. NPDC002669 TaxID=3364658 RepID=UPI003675C589